MVERYLYGCVEVPRLGHEVVKCDYDKLAVPYQQGHGTEPSQLWQPKSVCE